MNLLAGNFEDINDISSAWTGGTGAAGEELNNNISITNAAITAKGDVDIKGGSVAFSGANNTIGSTDGHATVAAANGLANGVYTTGANNNVTISGTEMDGTTNIIGSLVTFQNDNKISGSVDVLGDSAVVKGTLGKADGAASAAISIAADETLIGGDTEESATIELDNVTTTKGDVAVKNAKVATINTLLSGESVNISASDFSGEVELRGKELNVSSNKFDTLILTGTESINLGGSESGTLAVNGNLRMQTKNLTVDKDVAATGDVHLKGTNVEVNSTVTAGNDLKVEAAATSGGKATIDGATLISGKVTEEGRTTITGNEVEFKGDNKLSGTVDVTAGNKANVTGTVSAVEDASAEVAFHGGTITLGGEAEDSAVLKVDSLAISEADKAVLQNVNLQNDIDVSAREAVLAGVINAEGQELNLASQSVSIGDGTVDTVVKAKDVLTSNETTANLTLDRADVTGVENLTTQASNQIVLTGAINAEDKELELDTRNVFLGDGTKDTSIRADAVATTDATANLTLDQVDVTGIVAPSGEDEDSEAGDIFTARASQQVTVKGTVKAGEKELVLDAATVSLGDGTRDTSVTAAALKIVSGEAEKTEHLILNRVNLNGIGDYATEASGKITLLDKVTAAEGRALELLAPEVQIGDGVTETSVTAVSVRTDINETEKLLVNKAGITADSVELGAMETVKVKGSQFAGASLVELQSGGDISLEEGTNIAVNKESGQITLLAAAADTARDENPAGGARTLTLNPENGIVIDNSRLEGAHMIFAGYSVAALNKSEIYADKTLDALAGTVITAGSDGKLAVVSQGLGNTLTQRDSVIVVAGTPWYDFQPFSDWQSYLQEYFLTQGLNNTMEEGSGMRNYFLWRRDVFSLRGKDYSSIAGPFITFGQKDAGQDDQEEQEEKAE